MDTAERMSNIIGSSRIISATNSSIPSPFGVPQLELVRVVGREAPSELFTYVVDLRPVPLAADQSMFESDLDAAVGHRTILSIKLDDIGAGLLSNVGARTREVAGLITAIELIGGVDDNRRYHYTLHP